MKKMKTVKIKRILYFSCILFLLSCDKDNEKQEIIPSTTEVSKHDMKNSVDIDTLKMFLGNISGVSKDSITYDKNEEFFIWRNKKQINLQNLIEVYNQNK